MVIVMASSSSTSTRTTTGNNKNNISASNRTPSSSHGNSIKPIQEHTVHHIQSGQVIVDLTSVVKELVENSLDAGATHIEVRFKNQGLDGIEVQDNGKGIAPDDYAALALKHYTSKLSTYADLAHLHTFGFRGEALSSLCALSRFHVLTARAEDGPRGTKLEFDTGGTLKRSSIAAARQGTTIYVDDIFYNLPVRRKELERNIKRDYAKAIALLYAYACISTRVRFVVTNHVPKGKKASLVSTNANTTTKENIANVFGAKALLDLTELHLRLDLRPTIPGNTHAADRDTELRIEGHVSKPVFGHGRHAPDRQMYFVNGRPCALPQISKAFNEVYKSFNLAQSPFVFANLLIDTQAYDVNVSPDKRTIMLHDQTALLDTLKSALTEMFEQTDHTMPQSALPKRKLPLYKPLTRPLKDSGDPIPLAGERGRSGSRVTELGHGESESKAKDFEGLGNGGTSRGNDTEVVRTGSSLIHNWIGRNTEIRKESRDGSLDKDGRKLINQTPQKPPASVCTPSHVGGGDAAVYVMENDTGLCIPASKGFVTHGNMEPPSTLTVDVLRGPDPCSPPFGDPLPLRPSHQDRHLYEFGRVIDGLGESQSNSKEPEIQQLPDFQRSDVSPSQTRKMGLAPETPITVFSTSSQKAAPGLVENALDRKRPKRISSPAADITIGDETVTSTVVHRPPFKRQRIHQSNNSMAVVQRGATSPHVHGLRERFSSPGSQLQIESILPPTSSPAKDAHSEEESDYEGKDAALAALRRAKHRRPLCDIYNSDALDGVSSRVTTHQEEWDEETLGETEGKVVEDDKIALLTQDVEDVAAQSTAENLQRAAQKFKNGGHRKNATLQLVQSVQPNLSRLKPQLGFLHSYHKAHSKPVTTGDGFINAIANEEFDSDEAESHLSLTVTKADFMRMRIIGQFNLGFVIAARPSNDPGDQEDLFIIDQHAADEKYNYERLQQTLSLQTQRLVRPQRLELTALEEEIILNNHEALKANGFEVETVDEALPPGRRHCQLLTLPMSKGKTFDLSDLEELLLLLSEAPSGSTEIPRPQKVQRMLASRACRSSIMVGKTLTFSAMTQVVRHMGEMEKPWNCPHGRPTMRHLARLGAWKGWHEGDLIDAQERDAAEKAQTGRRTDWKMWLESK